MFYAVRTQQVTDTSAERQLLTFYGKEDRASYIEARGDAKSISAKDAHKFSFRHRAAQFAAPRLASYSSCTQYIKPLKSHRYFDCGFSFTEAKRSSRLLHQPRVRQPLLPRFYIL